MKARLLRKAVSAQCRHYMGHRAAVGGSHNFLTLPGRCGGAATGVGGGTLGTTLLSLRVCAGPSGQPGPDGETRVAALHLLPKT